MRTDPSERRCNKPNCGNPAAASFTFRYETAEVWVGDLAEPHPSRYDLCHEHAEQLTAPRGWERTDERSAAVERLPFAAGAEQDAGRMAVGGGLASSRTSAGGRPGNRYAGLSAELPRLAAQVHASEGAGEGASERGVPPITSRGLWPRPAAPPDAGGVVLDFDRPRDRPDGDEDGDGPPPGGSESRRDPGPG